MRFVHVLIPLAAFLTASLAAGAESASPYGRWENGPPAEASYFPIAVWLQAPRNAKRYSAAGINLYVGLWKGPTEKQLSELRAAKMPVICHQNAVGLKDPSGIIVIPLRTFFK